MPTDKSEPLSAAHADRSPYPLWPPARADPAVAPIVNDPRLLHTRYRSIVDREARYAKAAKPFTA